MREVGCLLLGEGAVQQPSDDGQVVTLVVGREDDGVLVGRHFCGIGRETRDAEKSPRAQVKQKPRSIEGARRKERGQVGCRGVVVVIFGRRQEGAFQRCCPLALVECQP